MPKCLLGTAQLALPENQPPFHMRDLFLPSFRTGSLKMIFQGMGGLINLGASLDFKEDPKNIP